MSGVRELDARQPRPRLRGQQRRFRWRQAGAGTGGSMNSQAHWWAGWRVPELYRHADLRHSGPTGYDTDASLTFRPLSPNLSRLTRQPASHVGRVGGA